jgi:rhodanese-related sulfurtransferase
MSGRFLNIRFNQKLICIVMINRKPNQMRLFLIVAYIFFFIPFTWVQEIDVDYQKMIERKYSFPTIAQDSLETKLGTSRYLILDTREEEEFAVSHIPGALHFGYNEPNYELINNIDTSKALVVYCSIGVRSQNIGEELNKRGFQRVYNLYGGIFLWADQFRPLERSDGEPTEKVHGYNKFWGRWIKKATVVYE